MLRSPCSVLRHGWRSSGNPASISADSPRVLSTALLSPSPCAPARRGATFRNAAGRMRQSATAGPGKGCGSACSRRWRPRSPGSLHLIDSSVVRAHRHRPGFIAIKTVAKADVFSAFRLLELVARLAVADRWLQRLSDAVSTADALHWAGSGQAPALRPQQAQSRQGARERLVGRALHDRRMVEATLKHRTPCRITAGSRCARSAPA